MAKMIVSVVIPTTPREASMAEEVKQSVLNSTFKNVEVIIVNEGKERSAQRNIGIDRSQGHYLMYLDSDQTVSRELISECVELMRCGYSGIYIPEVITTPGWFGRLRNFERSFYDGTAVDCVRFFKREGCPRFSLTLNGPEDAHHNRQIRGIKKVAKNCIYHHDRIGVFDYFKKKAYYAKSMRQYRELNPDDKVLDWKYRCFGVFIEDGKWKKLLRHPIWAVGIFLLIFARGIIYLRHK